jgi:hypothetical protein
VLRLTVAASLALAFATAAVGATPKVVATITNVTATSRVVHIVNRDRATHRRFVIQSINKPVIKAAKPCGFIQRDGFSIGPIANFRYRARCRKALGPGKSFNVYLTTSGCGRIDVFVVVKGQLLHIGP